MDVAARSAMQRLALLLAISITACATEATYKVHDEHGWPMTEWDAQHGEVLALSCPAMPHAYVLANGTRRPVVLARELAVALYTTFCAHKSRDEQLVLLSPDHQRALDD